MDILMTISIIKAWMMITGISVRMPMRSTMKICPSHSILCNN